MSTVQIAEHPLLDAGLFITLFPEPLGDISSPDSLLALLGCAAPADPIPVSRDDESKTIVRKMLRANGFKPAGRNKPAAEYLVKAAEDGRLGSINVAVDACNAVSLHSGLPISVVDADKAAGPYRIDVAAEDHRYVFNPSGQVIELKGLLCLFDAEGPCANAVKDCQRTKTDEGTTRTLSVVWGTRELEGQTAATLAWYRALLAGAGATTEDIGRA